MAVGSFVTPYGIASGAARGKYVPSNAVRSFCWFNTGACIHKFSLKLASGAGVVVSGDGVGASKTTSDLRPISINVNLVPGSEYTVNKYCPYCIPQRY